MAQPSGTIDKVSSTLLIHALISCFIAGLSWARVAYHACAVETNLNTVTEQAVVTVSVGLALRPETALDSAALDAAFVPSTDQVFLLPIVGPIRYTTNKPALRRDVCSTFHNSIRHRAAIIKQVIADSRIALIDDDGLAQIRIRANVQIIGHAVAIVIWRSLALIGDAIAITVVAQSADGDITGPAGRPVTENSPGCDFTSRLFDVPTAGELIGTGVPRPLRTWIGFPGGTAQLLV